MRLSTIPLFLLPTLIYTQEVFQPASSTVLTPSPIPTQPPTLELRQVAAPVAPAAAPAAPVAPVAAAPAPVGAAPVGGAAAPVNPAAAPAAVNNAPTQAAGAAPAATTAQTQAATVTTLMANVVVGGVTKQVPQIFTQTFASTFVAAQEVQSGSLGMGTLTGTPGAVKTGSAKSDGGIKRGGGRWDIGGLMFLTGVVGICII